MTRYTGDDVSTPVNKVLMTGVRSIEEPCAAKVARTVLKTSGGSDPLAEFNRCRIVHDTCRLRKAGIRDLVMEVCCALHNFRVRLTPWQPMV